ncbi:MAG: DUF4399 domain-containing protein [Phormidesmis sp.]
MAFLPSLRRYAQLAASAMLAFSILLAPVGLTGAASAQAIAANLSPAPETARAYLIEPSDGQTVPEEFAVKFGLVGMGIAPAGIDKAGTGHHHLLIDLDVDPDFTEPLPATANIKHFGGGQTETMLNLPPGEHTLQLLLGNYSHIPHDHPVLSDKIEITVE